jgi:hypothetical protein
MLSSGTQISRARSVLIAIILGSFLCYCLGGVVLVLANATRRVPPTPTSSRTPVSPSATRALRTQTPTITPKFFQTATQTISPTITITWTPSMT